ncbi:MAG TPA: hypothetical protein VFW92_10330 [Candidatus Limnocylindrales bacterium]|nr:hypothetical protein [Candidatus Limnocylindrales bacterium]
MDGVEWIRGRMSSLTCAACGRPYDRQRVRVLAQREGLFFLDLACPECGSEAVAIVSVEQTGDRTSRIEVGDLAEGAPVSAVDVLDMHRFLADFDGDFQRLFGPRGKGPAGTAGA